MEISIRDNGSLARAGQTFVSEAEKLHTEMIQAAEYIADEMSKEVKKSAASILPRRGGLARDVARMTLTVERKYNGARLVARSNFQLQRLDDGLVTHPVYGNPNVRVVQRIEPGFWTKATEKANAMMQQRGEKVLQDMAQRIEKG